MPNDTSAAKAFIVDIQTLHARAQEGIGAGSISRPESRDTERTIELLQTVLATEIACGLRYTTHAIGAAAADEAVQAEFQGHAEEEFEHMQTVAERIGQLGGTPNFNPEGLETRVLSECPTKTELVEMINADLIAERIAIDQYRELIRYFDDADPTTRIMLEAILKAEEQHKGDMYDLLLAHLKLSDPSESEEIAG